MGKLTGFLEYARKDAHEIDAHTRINNYNEFHIPLDAEDRQKQGARCMDCGVPYCNYGMILNNSTTGCPLNNLIPEWNELIYTGNLKEAHKRLRVTNRFPEFTSRVCPAPCEVACICGYTSGFAVTIKENEYAISENAYDKGYIKAEPILSRTGKRIAVVGSGPAGLAAADWLNKRGHNVTVYEKSDRVGGLLMYGIPNMKIEKHIIDRRVNIMKQEGIEFIINANVGANVSAAELVDRYDRVILCTGAENPRRILAANNEANGIYMAVDYLTEATRSLLNGHPSPISAERKNVLVIGGGDTGNDCVGTAIRQGASSVIQIEMMPEPPASRDSNNPWPEYPRTLKTDYGQHEAIAKFGEDPRIFSATVKEFFVNDEYHVAGALIAKLQPEKDEATGRINMIPTGEDFNVAADIVFIAAGFVGTRDYIFEQFGLASDSRNNIATTDFQTSHEKVYAAGDARRGQSLVVWALREGQDVARAVDKSLMGYSNL
ncbi:glutamate synthase subunit beta [Candidatus Epulonipiscium viviparus]|uniref:glutamate synthase subunit beta n=1 Tax=Candidatus Epulonipiscium viviparus TaxID=420336 RepID=UPI0027380CC7|nr:glutamate synthase subunit beta [Candidatus Epulopiscium viviparus]